MAFWKFKVDSLKTGGFLMTSNNYLMSLTFLIILWRLSFSKQIHCLYLVGHPVVGANGEQYKGAGCSTYFVV